MNDDGAVVDRSIEGFYPGVRIQDYRYLVYGNEDYTICPNPGSKRRARIKAAWILTFTP